eukprot:1589567-Pyramimonas_sp.AAC.1
MFTASVALSLAVSVRVAWTLLRDKEGNNDDDDDDDDDDDGYSERRRVTMKAALCIMCLWPMPTPCYGSTAWASDMGELC